MNTYSVNSFYKCITVKLYNYFFVIISILLLSVTGCTKLDEPVYSQYSTDQFFGSTTDVNAALVGMYRPLQICCGGPEQAGTFILNSASDEGNAILFWGQFDQLSYTPSSQTEIYDLWVATYKSISSANLIISNQEKIEALGEDFASASIAEAKFVRAMNYFQLVQMFGGVPLRTGVTSRADDVDIPRSSEDSVYAQIIADFKYAAEYLPSQNPAGKPTKWAAKSFLAKVYLTRKDYTNALNEAREVVASGAYSLLPEFADIFDPNKESSNKESIFSIQYMRQDSYGSRMPVLLNAPDVSSIYGGGGGWGLASVENGFYGKYKTGDNRINTTFSNPAPGQSTYYAGKWKDPLGVSADGHGNDFIIFRYADLLLLLAEAENEVNGPSTEAYNKINEVRFRASLPALTTPLSKDQFRDSVLFERHLELAYEEVRWFDLKRTGRLKSTLIQAGKTWDDKYYLFPIPQQEIDASNGIIKQNPGY